MNRLLVLILVFFSYIGIFFGDYVILQGFDDRSISSPWINHDIGLPEGLEGDFSYEIKPRDGSRDDLALVFSRAYDEISFNLGAGEYVEMASVDAKDLGDEGVSTTIITFYGSEGDKSFLAGGEWLSYNTFGLGLGRIESIGVHSLDGAIDDIHLNVVPEPGIFCLFVIGGLALRGSGFVVR